MTQNSTRICFRWFAGVLLVAAGAAIAAGQERADSRAARLLELAAGNLATRDLALARLRIDQAHRLDPAAVQASAVAWQLEQVRARESQCMEAGAVAARARELAAVRSAVRCLRDIDPRSSAALELVLRYQASLADQGGAFPRVSWEQWRDGMPEQ